MTQNLYWKISILFVTFFLSYVACCILIGFISLLDCYGFFTEMKAFVIIKKRVQNLFWLSELNVVIWMCWNIHHQSQRHMQWWRLSCWMRLVDASGTCHFNLTEGETGWIISIIRDGFLTEGRVKCLKLIDYWVVVKKCR